MAIATGGFLIGSQLGLVMGAMSSLKTIQSIPNFQRVLNIVQEVRNETSGAGGARGAGSPGGPLRHDHAATMPSAGHPRFPMQPRRSELMTDDAVAQQNQDFQIKNAEDHHGGNNPTGSARLDPNNSWSHVQDRAKELQNSAPNWNQIRQQNMPKSAWSNVRDGDHPRRQRTSGDNGDDEQEDNDDDNDDDESNGHNNNRNNRGKQTADNKSARTPPLSGWDRVRQGDAVNGGFVGTGTTSDGPSEFPRTREDLESRSPRRKNQYGDVD
ncbi:hypothetical protein BGZ58_003267 [Dissophora ornata]|nr:hypothetical protein BGZ58_003267 [Dissophora ornata]